MSWDDEEEDDWDSAPIPTLNDTHLPTSTTTTVPFDGECESVSDGEEETYAEVSTLKKTKNDSEKFKAKVQSKQKKKELDDILEKERENAAMMLPKTKEEKLEEKQRMQKLAENAGVEISNDIFSMKKSDGTFDSDSILSFLVQVPLTTAEDYKILAEAVGRRVAIEDKGSLAKEFLKQIARTVGRAISGEDLAEVIAVLGVVKNESVKLQLKKKKKKSTKKSVNIARNMDLNLQTADDFDIDRGQQIGMSPLHDANDYIDGDFM